MPGNVRLRQGEAGLRRASVVNSSQVRTIDKTRLGDSVGVVGAARMRGVLKGLALLFGTDEVVGDGARSAARHARRIRFNRVREGLSPPTASGADPGGPPGTMRRTVSPPQPVVESSAPEPRRQAR